MTERDAPPTIPTYSFNQTVRELRRLSEAYYAWAEAHEDIDFGPASDAFEWGNLLLNAADALDAAIDGSRRKRGGWRCDGETYRGDQCSRGAKVHYHDSEGVCVTHFCVQHAKQQSPGRPFDHMEVYGE